MARLIDSEEEDTSSSSSSKLKNSLVKSNKVKMNSVEESNGTTHSQRKVSFKTKQNDYHHKVKRFATKSNIDTNSKIAELAKIYNNSSNVDENSNKKKLNYNISIQNKMLPNVKDVIQIFEQPTNKTSSEKDIAKDYMKAGTLPRRKIIHSNETSFIKSSNLIVIRKNSVPRAKEIKVSDRNGEKSQTIVTDTSGQAFLKQTSTDEKLKINESNNKISEPSITFANIKKKLNNNSRPKSFINESENFLLDIKRNLKHTSMINLTNISQSNSNGNESIQHKFSLERGNMVNRNYFTLKPELKPKPNHFIMSERRKSISDLNSINNLSERTQQSLVENKNANFNGFQIELHSNLLVNKSEIDFVKINQTNQNSVIPGFRNQSHHCTENKKNLDTEDKIIKHQRLSIPKLSPDLENVLNHQNQTNTEIHTATNNEHIQSKNDLINDDSNRVQENFSIESHTVIKRSNSIESINKITKTGNLTLEKESLSEKIKDLTGGKVLQKMNGMVQNDEPNTNRNEIDNLVIQSKPNNSFLWRRSLEKKIKDINSNKTEEVNKLPKEEEEEEEAYTYIDIKLENIELTKSSSSPKLIADKITYNSLPNLIHTDLDDTYEELNYYSGNVYTPNIPAKEIRRSSERDITLVATKKNAQTSVSCSESNLLRAHSVYEEKCTHNYENNTLLEEENLYQDLNFNKQSKVLTNIDDRYTAIVKPKRDSPDGYTYETITSIRGDPECHYACITDDNFYDDVLNTVHIDECYEAILLGSESGSTWEKDNSIYGLKSPSVLSNNSSTSAASGFLDTSDEWVDVEQSDKEEYILVYRTKKTSRATSTNRKTWSQKVRRQRSKLSNRNKYYTKVGIKSTSIVVFGDLKPSLKDHISPPVPPRPRHNQKISLTGLRCHDKCGISYEAQELNVYLPSESDGINDNGSFIHNKDVIESNPTTKNSDDEFDDDDDDEDSFSDSFDDSDSSSEFGERENPFNNMQERSLPPIPISPNTDLTNQNIYDFVKQAGNKINKMKKQLTKGSLLKNLRRKSKINIPQLPISPKTSETDSKSQKSSRIGRWPSFKTKNRSDVSSTFYLNNADNDNPDKRKTIKTETYLISSPPPTPPERNHRKSISVSQEKDIRRQSIALRPSSPPPPPPPNIKRSISPDDSKSEGQNNSSRYNESNIFDSSLSDQEKILRNTFWYTDRSFWDLNGPTSIEPSTSDSTSETGSDLHLRFVDEPLYQFYNARVSVIPFNSNPEENGYEEIGSTQNRPSMLDLIAPSNLNRSLWCQLPEVIDSGLLDTLSSAERNLIEAKFELITSEASYFKSLLVVEKHFMGNPLLQDDNILLKSNRKHLFGNVSAVRKCSEKLLAALVQCWQDSILLNNICEVMYEHVTNKAFNIYVKYCANQVHIDRTLKSLREGNPKFCEVLSELESNSICQSLPLSSFLMLPMQRITRLPLLFDAILTRLKPNHSEYETCHTTLVTLNKIVHECNEETGKMERYYEMLSLSRVIKFSQNDVKGLPVISSSRWLVRSGPMNVVNIDNKQTFNRRLTKSNIHSKFHLFLFTDLLIITKKKSDGSYTVIDYCPRAMTQIVPLDDSVPPTNNYLLLLTLLENHENKTVEMVLSCDTDSGRQRWLEALTPPSSDNPEETLYEQWDCPQVVANHTYSSQQPDELNLQPGDVINVLRKMSDGWYHGERISDSQKGWFPGNYTSEIASSHTRAKNLKQRYRLLALSGNYLQSQQRK